MDLYRLLSDTDNRPSIAAQGVIERNVFNHKEAPLSDVMYEQLKYLIEHSNGDCLPNCIDCDRLQKIRTLLLLPFRSDS